MKEKVFAHVGDLEITQKDLDELVAVMPPEYANHIRQAGTQALVEEAIAQELFYLDGLARGLDHSEAYQLEMKRLAKQLLRGVAINDVLKDVTVQEEEMNAYYEEHASEFFKEEERGSSHILVESEEQAIELLEKIRSGASFSDLARDHSSCPSASAGGHLGLFGRGRMVPEFEEVAFLLKEGEVSEPVLTQFGYHLIKVDSVHPAGSQVFEEVRETIYQTLLNQKQQALYTTHLTSLREQYPVRY